MRLSILDLPCCKNTSKVKTKRVFPTAHPQCLHPWKYAEVSLEETNEQTAPYNPCCPLALGPCNRQQLKRTRNDSQGQTSQHSCTVRHSEFICLIQTGIVSPEMLKSTHSETAINVCGMSKGWFDHIHKRADGLPLGRIQGMLWHLACRVRGHCKGLESGHVYKRGRSICHRLRSCPRHEDNGKQPNTVPGTENLNLMLTGFPTWMTLTWP